MITGFFYIYNITWFLRYINSARISCLSAFVQMEKNMTPKEEHLGIAIESEAL